MKRLLGIFAISFFMYACGEGKVKIAVILPLEKSKLTYGIDAKNGLNLALVDQNTNNLEFTYCDTEGKAERFEQCYEEAVRNGATLVFGPILSDELSNKAIELINKHKVPVISPSISSDRILKASEYIFSFAATNSVMAANLGFILKELKVGEVIVVYEPANEFSKDITERLEKALKHYKIKVVSKVRYEGSRTDLVDKLSKEIGKFSKGTKNAIVLNIYFTELPDVLMDVREKLKYEGILAGPDSWDLVQVSDREIPGQNIHITHFYPLENQMTRKFAEDYRKKYNKLPASWSALSYDAMTGLLKVLEKVKVPERQRIVKTLKFLKMEGLTGEIDFGGDNMLEDKSIVFVKYTGKQRIFLRRTNVSSAIVQ